MSHKKISIAITLLVVLTLIPISALAATATLPYSGGTLTITYPDNFESCTPKGDITVSGVTAGHDVTVYFQYRDATTGWIYNIGSHVFTAPGGSWPFPYYDNLGGTMVFGIAVFDNYAGKQIGGYKWTVTCVPSTGTEGCTPGYWRNHYASWPAPYVPSGFFNDAFEIDANHYAQGFFSDSYTLRQAIWQGGGGLNRLARHGTAALLSAAHPDVDYPYTVAQVIEMVQAGTIDPLAWANELGCPID